MKRSIMEKPKLDVFSSFLVGMLALAGLNYLTASGSIVIIILASAYFLAVLGVLMKEKFGPIIAIGVSSFDLIYVIYEGFNVVGLILDVIIMYLAFREYQRMSFPLLAQVELEQSQRRPVIICPACGAKNKEENVRKCRICGKKLRK